MFGRTRRAVCCLLGILGGVAALAVPARAEVVNIAPDLDCGVDYLFDTENNCTSEEHEAGARFGHDTRAWKMMLQFDVDAALPPGAVVTSATLNLYGGVDGFSHAYTVDVAWDDTVTWLDAPTSGIEDSTESTGPWTSYDVTGAVHAWVSGVSPNYGLAAGNDPSLWGQTYPVGTDGEGTFAASETAGTTFDPYLTVEYFVPCPSDPFAAAQSSAASTVYAWNEVLLDAFRVGGPPTRHSRAAAMLNVGIYDVFNSVFFAKLEDLSTGDPGASETCGWEPYVTLAETPASTNANLAAGIAARDILSAVYPGYATEIGAAFVGMHGVGPHQAAAEDLGGFVADEVLAARASDGSDASPTYTPASSTPGAWRETPTESTVAPCDVAMGLTPSGAVSPGWGNVTPFTLGSGNQFRQPLPGAFSSYASLLASAYYADQVEEVRLYGEADSTMRTDPQEDAAWFWANDLDGTYKPPGHLLQHTREVAETQPAAQTSGDPEDFFRVWSQQGVRVARLYAEVSLAMADAAIAAWDQKYLTAIDLWRPYHAITLGDTDGNDGTPDDDSWEPLSRDRAEPEEQQFSPCFPAWVSGHATFGGAWSRTMEREFERAEFDDPFPLTLSSEDPHALERDADERVFDSFSQAAEENAESRIWLGVHYRVDAEDGLATGRAVADHVTTNALRAEQKCEDWDCTDPIS